MEGNSSGSWFDGDFEDDDLFSSFIKTDSRPPPPKKKKKDFPAGRRRRKEEDFRDWVRRYAPEDANSLAVHHKKVQDVRSWLLKAFSSCNDSSYRKALILSGPSGSGKTATIRALSQELNFRIREWTNENWLESKTINHFLRQAGKYSSLFEDKSARSLVLVEERPTSHSLEDFKNSLLQFGGFYFPLVLIRGDDRREIIDFENALQADRINFNPVSNTNLVKALRSVASSESQAGVKSFEVPDNKALMLIAEAAKGDIRAAINALQFTCLKGSSLNRKKSRDPVKKSGSVLGSKDLSLDMFHAIGKVLYAKRLEDMEPCTLRSLKNKRRVLKTDPQDIIDYSPLSFEAFSCFLHENYGPFFEKIEDLSLASEYLSLSDEYFMWNADAVGSKVQVTEYGGLLSVRGLLFHNPGRTRSFGGLKTFSKPMIYGNIKDRLRRIENVQPQFSCRSLASTELFTNLLPLLIKIAPCSKEVIEVAGGFTDTEQNQASQHCPGLNGGNPLDTELFDENFAHEEDDYRIEEFK